MSSHETVKVVLIGEAGVGKTCIVNRYISNKFDSEELTSISAQFISKIIDFPELGKQLKFDIWDTAGQEKFRSLAKIFYKDSKIICLCYDITSKRSFDELRDYWYEKEIKENLEDDTILVVVANKSDLYINQEVKDDEGKKFAKDINAFFQSTSAKSKQGIDELFEKIGHKFLDPNFDINSIENKEKAEYEKKKNEKEKQTYIPQTQSRKVKIQPLKNDNQNTISNTKKGCCK